MLNIIAKYFTSLFAFLTAPLRAIWRGIVRYFPERDFTIMDTPTGHVYSFHQTSFWRFTKFCGKLGLIIWATWSTYVFVYHRPMLDARTRQLEETKQLHARQVSDLQTYLSRYNELAKELNLLDDRVLNAEKLTDTNKEDLMKQRLNIWGELDFLNTRINTVFADAEYVPQFSRLSELELEYELIRIENDALKSQNDTLTRDMLMIADADSQIVELTAKLAGDAAESLREQMTNIKTNVANLGLTETMLVEQANQTANTLVGAAFVPLAIDKNLDPKYQKLADDLEMWHGLTRLNEMLPLGMPTAKTAITSHFGARSDPFTGAPAQHKGIDFAGKIGTELFAVAPGRVVSAGERVGYGKTVEVDHGLGFTTLYAHLSAIRVTRGDWVRPGTIVGLGGNSGRSTGPHLHYEIRYKGAPFNPANFIKE